MCRSCSWPGYGFALLGLYDSVSQAGDEIYQLGFVEAARWHDNEPMHTQIGELLDYLSREWDARGHADLQLAQVRWALLLLASLF